MKQFWGYISIILDHFIGEWSFPEISGQYPPPSSSFLLNKLSNDKGILYGGIGNGDTFIVELSSDRVVTHTHTHTHTHMHTHTHYSTCTAMCYDFIAVKYSELCTCS